jgi:succinate-semialdehyde dehydrogenase/glutarate-semialdehyde dehydrogenase
VLEEAGLPPAILNVITTSSPAETVGLLLEDPSLRKLSFTGSTEVGRSLMAQASHQLLRVSMELGGNALFVVFEDADLEAAVEGAVVAKKRNIGEACTAAKRFHVAARVAGEFADRLARRLAAMVVGRGLRKAWMWVRSSTRRRGTRWRASSTTPSPGAPKLVGGRCIDGPGFLSAPAVLEDVPAGARALKKEIFGPMAPVTAFGSEEDAVAAANDTLFGLVAHAFTKDLRRAFRAMEGLETGMVGLNQGMVSNPAAPFGGVKLSRAACITGS